MGKHGNKQRKEFADAQIEEAKDILKEELKGKTITITREWGARYPDGKRIPGHPIPPMERADMMKTLIEKPDIKSKDFGAKYGYQLQPGKSDGAIKIMDILKEEIAGYKIPEMEEILRADLLIVAHGIKELHRRLRDDPDSLAVNELSLAIDKSFKRSRLLQGKSTSNVAINIQDVKTMKEDDLDAFLNDAVRIVENSPQEKE